MGWGGGVGGTADLRRTRAKHILHKAHGASMELIGILTGFIEAEPDSIMAHPPGGLPDFNQVFYLMEI